MHALAILAALCGSAAAVPGPVPAPVPGTKTRPLPSASASAVLRARDGTPADPSSPWVSVDDEGRPSTTFTPSMTTISGTPSAVNGAPHDLTASVYTWTSWGSVSTSTGSPPNPTAAAGGSPVGSFSRCFNRDGEFAPFCRPSHNSTLLTGTTYYVTWDPDFYNTTALVGKNTTVDITVRLDFWNHTSSAWEKLVTLDDARVPAAWGFFPLPLDDSYRMGEKLNNISISLLAGPAGSQDRKNSVRLPLAAARPALPSTPPTQVPRGKTLFIALPISIVAFVALVVGGCVWNQKTRRIELGNIMGRSRRGYSGRGTRRRMMMFQGARAKEHHGIQLDDGAAATQGLHEGPLALRGDGGAAAAAAGAAGVGYRDVPERARRDSDVLGSLAESPVRDEFEHDHDHDGHVGGGNAFRDEIARQDEERQFHAY
ncbi:hypothetical protein ESCO_000335 [Escovopsis weberi]|uniref:Uncharacterized protein n=1 Tax=Escovopsis weberi TaxID=150374 RepID=A0A0M8N3D4_ESCWE|nr:hypothetical protein ESCO_000335 [Escovopsis weberi]